LIFLLTWYKYLKGEFDKPYLKEINDFLVNCQKDGKLIYPPLLDIFNAYFCTSFESVKVVIIGQDPYHGQGQANGLAFSVSKEVAIPPSLKNIYKEIERDLNIKNVHGDLRCWAEQGVLLLNSILTVEENLAGSHQNIGWENFTDKTISSLSKYRDNIVFLLWGSKSIKKSNLIDDKKHLVLTAPHPSPLSAYRGFIGCSHFSKCNQYLKEKGLVSIDWSIS